MEAHDPRLWDAEAASFDEAPDHGLLDPRTRDAWRRLLLEHLPPAPARVADLGCGTGTLSVLLADEGFLVEGVDFSPEMVRLAHEKAAGRAGVHFTVGDAGDPPLRSGVYDAALCRHVLWALPDPAAALRRWIGLLGAFGRLVLVEGSWGTGAGLTAEQTTSLVRASGRPLELVRLEGMELWGQEVDDERYLVLSMAAGALADPG